MKVVKTVLHRVKPGRIDDALKIWKEGKQNAKVADINVLHCDTGGDWTDTYMVTMTFDSPEAMVEGMGRSPDKMEQSWRRAHDADSPYESTSTANWHVIDLEAR